MTYLSYTERKKWGQYFLRNLRELLTKNYALNPDQAANIASQRALIAGRVTSGTGYNTKITNSTNPNHSYYNSKIFRMRAQLANTFKHMPEKLRADVNARQQEMINAKELVITPKLAHFKRNDIRGAGLPLMSRDSEMATNFHIEALLEQEQKDFYWERFENEQVNDIPHRLQNYSRNEQIELNKLALTSLAIHLTRLQLITQCMPHKN